MKTNTAILRLVFVLLISQIFSVTSLIASSGCKLIASIKSYNPVYCYSDSNGSASATQSGGTKPYTYSWAPYGGSDSIANDLITGTYTVTVKDSLGCVATATVFIAQPARLNVSVTVLSSPSCPTCCDGRAKVLYGGGEAPYTGNWCNGYAGLFWFGDTTLCAGMCYCCVTDANGCRSCDSINMVAPTGVSSYVANSYCSIFPNPSNGKFTLKISNNQYRIDNVEIYNELGQQVYIQALRQAQGDYAMDLTNQPAGIYLYRIISDKGEYIASAKLVIE